MDEVTPVRKVIRPRFLNDTIKSVFLSPDVPNPISQKQYQQFGVFKFPNQQSFHGSYKNWQRNGKGKKYFGNQVEYDGEWKDDQFQGFGKQFNRDFKGFQSIERKVFRDFNKMKKEEWKSFVGEFSNGKWNGKGTLTLSNNFYFTGNFHENQLHGKGTLFSPSKTKILIGNYYNNKLCQEY